MDAEQFDSVVKALGQGTARRRLLTGLVGIALVGRFGYLETAANPSRKSQHRRRQRANAEGAPPKPNGRKCGTDGQCQSGHCCPPSRGKQGTCQACCVTPSCDGRACGVDDGCGGTCQGGCGNGLTCCIHPTGAGTCTSLGIPTDCLACNDSCTHLAGECSAPGCGVGCCFRVPTNEGSDCQGESGTCTGGFCVPK